MSEQTMIERVARDMAAEFGWIWEGPKSQMVERYASGQTGMRARDYWRKLACAAIEAMRVPNSAMITAGQSAGGPITAWTAMIDAAHSDHATTEGE